MFYVPSGAMPMSMPAFVPAPAYNPIGMQPLNNMMPQQQGAWVFCPTPAIYPTPDDLARRMQQPDRLDSRAVKNAKVFKTELCRSWMDFARCNYGSNCVYAHGEAELRSQRRHPKYKTEPCTMFALYGNCAYGGGCHFVHDPSIFGDTSTKSASAHSISSAATSSLTNENSAIRWPSADLLDQGPFNQQNRREMPSASQAQSSGRLPVFLSITESHG